MEHIKALAIKLVSCFVLLWLVLGGIYGLDFGDIVTISLVLGIAAYILGDLIILPLTNNTIATISDFGLALAVIWMMSSNLTPLDNLFTASLIAAIGVGIFEFIFHKYMARTVLDKGDERREEPGLRYQTEASEELTDIRIDEDDLK
ncbi:hypothetical protein HNQ94_001994 [Salirhabdus euzebyi]|uniref:DUF2512 family protein n=1 Tax=Salirhabdus euzebyi TaxID=394506 RepID=A0A841Q576_9BACI|nr:YndM family protein [Salirhabdus euzebyi]MBB6453545.1 hypothetical protein [Salirhabdus euzebyi]